MKINRDNGRRKWVFWVAVLIAGFFASSTVSAETFSVSVGALKDLELKIGGQLRLRHQSQPAPRTEDFDRFTNYRVRLNFDFRLGDSLRVFVQPQWVGVFGDNNTGAAVDFSRTPENFSFHQAYLDWNVWKAGGGDIGVRAGRFELVLADHRLIGDFRWSQRGRSFDGAGVWWGNDNQRLSLYYAALAGDLFEEPAPAQTSGGPTGGPLPAGDTDSDQDLWTLHYMNKTLIPKSRIELTYIFDDELKGVPFSGSGLPTGSPTGFSGTERHTFGAFIARTDARGKHLSPLLSFNLLHPNEPGLYWRGEFYYQTGKLGPGTGPGAARNPGPGKVDINAFMYAAHLGYHWNDLPMRPFVWGGWEWLSGDDDPADGDYEVFDTLYPTNHAYYGYMDYFLLSLPGDTGLQGLRDAFLSATVHPLPKTGLGLTWHNFALTDNRSGIDDSLGDEVDVTLLWKAHKYVVLLFGYSHFFTGKGMEDLGRITPGNDPDFSYAMINVRF